MKKSLYVFFCSLLGLFMFLILHSLAVFFYLLLASNNPEIFFGRLSYLEMTALDFFTLIVVMLLGVWYGIALGLKWYAAVYEQEELAGFGFVDRLIKTCWPAHKRDYDLSAKVQKIANKLQNDVLELEHLTTTVKPKISTVKPIKRRMIRRRTVVKDKI